METIQRVAISTEMRLSELCGPLKATLHNGDAVFQTVSIDTRTVEPGELFVAVKGPHFDGHDFIAKAAEKGAIGAVVSHPVNTTLPYLVVANPRTALAQMAMLRRQQIQIPLLAVTGSCGKTTAKAMISSIMSHCGLVYAGRRSYNNHYGLPLTILGITDKHQYAVVEIGANHFGEIANLTQIACPTVAGITIAAPVHLEGFGDLAGVARAKGEIFQGLTEDGVAVINLEDGQSEYWLAQLKDKRVITFGYSSRADVFADNIVVDAQGLPSFTLHTSEGIVDITLPLLGEHNITNALAACAITLAAKAPLSAIKKGLETLTPVAKRMVRHVNAHGIEILDDSYNSNPLAVEAALKVLAQSKGKKILVLGEMAELGDLAEKYHYQLGQQAHQFGVENIYAIGELMQHTVEAFGQGAFYFENQTALISKLQTDLTGKLSLPCCVLIKGSRSTKMENVVEALLAEK